MIIDEKLRSDDRLSRRELNSRRANRCRGERWEVERLKMDKEERTFEERWKQKISANEESKRSRRDFPNQEGQVSQQKRK
jgi:hypothetical protein